MTGGVGSAVGNARGPVGRTRDFERARRHSRWVRFYKIAIPVGALLGIAGVTFIAFLDPFRSVEGLTLGPVSVSGSQVTMEAPKLTGFRDDSRPYEVTATAAVQDVRKPNLVELQNMKARIVTDDQGGAAHLEATIGILDTRTEKMELRDNVRVRTDAGQEAILKSASVNFKAGTVISKEPVTVSLGNGVIRASGLEVRESGKVLHFKGRVHTVFEGSPEPAASPDSPLPPAAANPDPAPESSARAQPTSLRP